MPFGDEPFGDPERQLQRLLDVQPRIARGLVAAGQIGGATSGVGAGQEGVGAGLIGQAGQMGQNTIADALAKLQFNAQTGALATFGDITGGIANLAGAAGAGRYAALGAG